MFCEVVINLNICRKKKKKILTFEKSNFWKKSFLNVYTIEKNGYNKNTEDKKEVSQVAQVSKDMTFGQSTVWNQKKQGKNIVT